MLKFWKRAGFVPVYLRQSVCDLTGEHTCIMLKEMKKGISFFLLLPGVFVHFKKNDIDEDDLNESIASWLVLYWAEFRRRILRLFGFDFDKFLPQMALSILQLKNNGIVKQCKRKG